MPIEHKLLKLTWTLAAWEDYEYWQGQDRKTLSPLDFAALRRARISVASRASTVIGSSLPR